MAISKITSSGLAGDKYNVMTAGNNYYEPLASTLVTSTASAITFSNIPQGYKHLQVRYLSKTTRVGGASGSGTIQFNGDTSTNYSTHALYGDGATPASNGYANSNYGLWYYGDTTTFVAGILDILDYTNTNKYKTAKNILGYDQNGTGQVGMISLGWYSTAAITSITFTPTASYSFNTNSRFSLYGLKGQAMARTGTYTQIASNTVGTATPSITFSAIPGTYTDLVIVSNFGSSTTTQTIETRVNGETSASTNYSWTWVFGSGTTATSTRGSNDNRIPVGQIGTSVTTTDNNSIFHFMDYANTTTNKNVLGRFNTPERGVVVVTGMFRSTTAISSISIFTQAGNFNVGSTFTLYGIEAYK